MAEVKLCKLCNLCVYYPKCGEKPSEENGCKDYKNSEMFMELPFMVNQIVYYIEAGTKYVPVIIDGDAYFKLEDDSKIRTHTFNCGELVNYLPPMIPGFVRDRRKYYATKEEAEKALEEVKNRGRSKMDQDCD